MQLFLSIQKLFTHCMFRNKWQFFQRKNAQWNVHDESLWCRLGDPSLDACTGYLQVGSMCCHMKSYFPIATLRLRQNGCHLQTAFWKMKWLYFLLKFHGNLFPRVQLTSSQSWSGSTTGSTTRLKYLMLCWLIYVATLATNRNELTAWRLNKMADCLQTSIHTVEFICILSNNKCNVSFKLSLKFSTG